MSIERSTLEARAVKHAALADPLRLQVIDLLALGDRSPTELGGLLAIGSNLLAHHLGILERAGIVARHRSEADRRRSYVRLLPDAFDDVGQSVALTPRRVLFVCTANSARSQLATALWSRASHVPVASAGTHPADRIAPGAVAAAERHGLVLPPDHAPRLLDDVIDADDFVITVCDKAHEERGELGGLHWSVPDPVPAASQAAFELALDDLATRVEHLTPHLSTT